MIPTPHSLLVRRYFTTTERDAHGNPVAGHGAPEPVAVHAIAPGASAESVAAGRDIARVEWTVYAPAGTVIDARDLVIVGDNEYQVDGDSRDWTCGPWINPVAGVVFELSKKEG